MLMEVSTLMLRPQFLPAGIVLMISFSIASSFTKRRYVEASFTTIGEILYVALFVWEG
jgi:hypothetical protein